ncbi:hypothetical protein AC1031_007048 [Aphanomyces cochlioides]|nr:hypothetical protein AC1031_007048 [Aphanomyces cochlioides]
MASPPSPSFATDLECSDGVLSAILNGTVVQAICRDANNSIWKPLVDAQYTMPMYCVSEFNRVVENIARGLRLGTLPNCTILNVSLASIPNLFYRRYGAISMPTTLNEVVVTTPVTTTAGNANDSASTKSSAMYIVASLLGVACLMIAIVFILWRRKRQVKSSPEFSLYEPLNDRYAMARPMTDLETLEATISKLAVMRIDHKQVMKQRCIGAGAFGEVWLATYQGRNVAVKKTLGHKSKSADIQHLIDEISLMSRFNSPYVVCLVGASWDRLSDLQCVMEYMDQGDLRDKLANTTTTTFPWREKLDCILSIAEGLVYVHSYDIIHRDLKSRNVLLDSTHGTKLTDFGVAREDTQETMTMGVGTYRWMAPELLKDSYYSVAADIYSFGILLSEFDTHLIPYSDQANQKGQPLVDTNIMAQVVLGSLQPTFSDSCPPWLRELALQCISHEPTARPTAMQVSMVVRQHIKAQEADAAASQLFN